MFSFLIRSSGTISRCGFNLPSAALLTGVRRAEAASSPLALIYMSPGLKGMGSRAGAFRDNVPLNASAPFRFPITYLV